MVFPVRTLIFSFIPPSKVLQRGRGNAVCHVRQNSDWCAPLHSLAKMVLAGEVLDGRMSRPISFFSKRCMWRRCLLRAVDESERVIARPNFILFFVVTNKPIMSSCENSKGYEEYTPHDTRSIKAENVYNPFLVRSDGACTGPYTVSRNTITRNNETAICSGNEPIAQCIARLP